VGRPSLNRTTDSDFRKDIYSTKIFGAIFTPLGRNEWAAHSTGKGTNRDVEVGRILRDPPDDPFDCPMVAEHFTVLTCFKPMGQRYVERIMDQIAKIKILHRTILPNDQNNSA
jgi:hypothetical protein